MQITLFFFDFEDVDRIMEYRGWKLGIRDLEENLTMVKVVNIHHQEKDSMTDQDVEYLQNHLQKKEKIP